MRLMLTKSYLHFGWILLLLWSFLSSIRGKTGAAMAFRAKASSNADLIRSLRRKYKSFVFCVAFLSGLSVDSNQRLNAHVYVKMCAGRVRAALSLDPGQSVRPSKWELTIS